METSQSLSRKAKAAYVAVLVVPLVVLLAWGHATSAETVVVNAEVAMLDDGRTVVSAFVTNPCGEPLRLDIAESAEEVRVRTLVRQDNGFLGGCSDFGTDQRLVATLAEPLGTRRLVAVRPGWRFDG